MLSQLKFPPRSLFAEAAYVPLFIEPIVGSGERLCFGVVIKFGERRKLVIVPAIKRLSRFYGSASKSLLFAITLAKDSIDAALKSESTDLLVMWRSPVEGIILGESRVTSARNYDDCVRIAFSQCASLFEIPATEEDLKAHVIGRRVARLTVSRLEKSVADGAIQKNPALHSCFFQRFQVSPHARPTRVGFVGPRLVANFGILVPHNLRSFVDSAKARILDLERLRDDRQGSLFELSSAARFELFMKSISSNSVEYSETQIKTVDQAVEEIRFLANKSEITYQAYETPERIVNAILQAEVA